MLEFLKYQGTGNDFVIVDDRKNKFKNDTKSVKLLCDRKFGIGGDGLILLQRPDNAEDHFKMVYYNADGRQSTMCGNGGRCLVHFAHTLGLFKDTCRFEAIDGHHEAAVKSNGIQLSMNSVKQIEKTENTVVLDTGSPHHIEFVQDINRINVRERGAAIRYGKTYAKEGINVNFVKADPDGIHVRTYERGVEDETLSCGTGVTAAAIAAHAAGKTVKDLIPVKTPGGNLSVSFSEKEGVYSNVLLIGPATPVFKGYI